MYLVKQVFMNSKTLQDNAVSHTLFHPPWPHLFLSLISPITCVLCYSPSMLPPPFFYWRGGYSKNCPLIRKTITFFISSPTWSHTVVLSALTQYGFARSIVCFLALSDSIILLLPTFLANFSSYSPCQIHPQLSAAFSLSANNSITC